MAKKNNCNVFLRSPVVGAATFPQMTISFENIVSMVAFVDDVNIIFFYNSTLHIVHEKKKTMRYMRHNSVKKTVI